jgi:hypothetical protein
LPRLCSALLLALGTPIGPVAAGVPSDTNASGTAKQALPSEAAKTDGVIVVADKNKNKNWNNKNWNNKKVVVVRPYRPWNKKAYYGTIVGGVALGAVLAAGAYAAGPPAPNLCWYWYDPTMTRGYWDYCQ